MSNPPVAEKRTNLITQHGIERDDPYSWLKADNWQQVMQDPSVLPDDIRSYLDAENRYTDTFFANDTGLTDTLFEELKGRIKEDDGSVPQKDDNYHYFHKFEQGQQYPQFYRVKSSDAFVDQNDAAAIKDAELLYDANEAAKDSNYFALGGLQHSDDQKHLAIAVDLAGSEYYDVEIRTIKSGEVIDRLPQISGDLEWCADNKSVIYTRLDENHRPASVHLHRIGDSISDDVLLFEETDPGYFVSIAKSESGTYLFINAHQHDTSEVYVMRSDDPQPAESPVRRREAGVEYSLHHHGRQMLIHTNLASENADGKQVDATNFRVATASTDNFDDSQWRELIAASDTNTIVDLTVYEDYMVRLERVNALPRIVITRFEDGDEHAIEFEEEAYSLGLSGGYEYNTTNLRFSYSSPTSPNQVFDYDMGSRDRVLRKTQEVPSGHDASAYVTRRFFATGHDGVKIPVTSLALKSTEMDGSAPVLLYGYGSYGMSMPASFSTGVLSLVNRGFVYVIGHVRGGSEMGEAWYKNGRGEEKTNTFHDFISVAEDLIDRDMARKGKIAIHGGSAGGMLVGAVVNMRPDLFKAVVGQVPFVDVLTTMSDLSLPLTPIEWPEWGNPVESKEAYERIASYSPIDKVEAKDYPAIFAIGGLTDPRVTYWEPAKWVATLRERVTSDEPVLLKTNMEAGHGGASGRFDRLKETALIYTFLLKSFDLA